MLTTYKANIDERSTWALFKVFVLKKLLVMARNRSTFLMDLIFPCVMIIGGLYISKLDFIHDPMPARNLSAYDFPKSVPLIRNLDSFFSSQDQISEFVKMGFSDDVGPGKMWSEDLVVPLDKNSTYYDHLTVFD
jgi:hypothetical protein